MRLISIFIFLIFCSIQTANSISQYYCTASDAQYFKHLLNFIGSIHTTNYEKLKEIAVFNLGMTTEQKDLLGTIEKVHVYNIELTHSDLIKPVVVNKWGKRVPGWYAWKFVVWKQALDMFPYALWIDAGATILKKLDDLFRHIKHRGYFAITIGNEYEHGRYRHPVLWQTTHRVLNKFNLCSPQNKHILRYEAVTTAIVGFSRAVKNTIISDLFSYTNSLYYFIDDNSTPQGFGSSRHDQSIFTAYMYTHPYTIYQQDYTQEIPIVLETNKSKCSFYITWNQQFVSDKTAIYHSRSDMSNFNYFLRQIKIKNSKAQI